MFHPVEFEGWKVRVPTTAHPWPEGCKERASINSFGIGGSNAHVVIESHHEHRPFSDYADPNALQSQRRTNPPFLIVLTGNSVKSMEMNISNLYTALQQSTYDQIPFCQLSKEINTRSQASNRPFQSYFVAKSARELAEALHGYTYDRQRHIQKQNRPRLLFTFTGQGAFWSQMGKTLMDWFMVAEETLRRLDDVISGLQSDKATRWSLIGKIGQAEYCWNVPMLTRSIR